MILKDLLLITFGGGGFLGLMGTSGYFVYRQEAIKNVERDISATLGEINTEVQNLIGKKVDEQGNIVSVDVKKTVDENSRDSKITEINELINSAKNKNNTSWKHYVDGIDSILTRYEEIVKKEEKNPLEELLKSKPVKKPAAKPVAAKPAAARPVAARPVATKTEATKTEATKTKATKKESTK